MLIGQFETILTGLFVQKKTMGSVFSAIIKTLSANCVHFCHLTDAPGKGLKK